MSDSIAKLKEQRRRNAKTIRDRNETIRHLQWKIEQLEEIAIDRKFVSDVLRKLLEERQGKGIE